MNLYLPPGATRIDRSLCGRSLRPLPRAGAIIESVRAAARAEGMTFYWYSPIPHCHYNTIAHGLGNKSCAAMDGLLSVSPSGDVLPCSSYPEPMGNLLTTGFREIWFSARARHLQEQEVRARRMRGMRELRRLPGRLPAVLALAREQRKYRNTGMECGAWKECSMELNYVIPKSPSPARLVILAGFAVAGFALQVLLPGGYGFLPGVIVMVAGLLFMFREELQEQAHGHRAGRLAAGLRAGVRPDQEQPADDPGEALLRDLPQRVRHFHCRCPGRSLPPLQAGAGGVVFFDALVLLISFLFTGNINLWTPQELAFRMRVFEPILSSAPAEGADIIVTPYLRLDKNKEGQQIPEDIRLMVEPRRKPADFLGVQLQVAVNKGPNGNVPYLYSVFLCKGKGRSYETLGSMRFGDYIEGAGGRHGVRVRGGAAEDNGHGIPHNRWRRPPSLRDGHREAEGNA